MATPNRGEIWLVDLGSVAKTRPCLALGVPAENEARAVVALVAHTISMRNFPFEVESDIGFLRAGAFDAQNLVTVPTPKLICRLGLLGSGVLGRVEDAVRRWLGL